jgi:hypothetical protein
MKRLFIIGCPRSGTTWTGLLLAQHPEVVVCQQIGVVWAAETFKKWWGKGEKKPETRYMSSRIRYGAADETPRFEQLMTRDEMLSVCRGVADQTYGFATKDAPGCTVVVDKTPENVRHPEFMVELLPDAYFLHIIRDPRSVFNSHRHGSKDFGAAFPTDPVGSAMFWTNDVKRGRRIGQLTPNYRELRYESLKENGRAELTGILEWLGLSADPAWVDAVLAKTSVEKLQKSQGTPKSFFRAGKSAGWRDELTERELHAVEYFARDLMVGLGYEPVLPNSDRKTARMHAREMVNGVVGRARTMRARLRGQPA